MEGVSPSVVLVPAQSKSRRLAAKACWAAWVRMADQRDRREASTALRRMLGTALAFVWAKRRRKVVVSGLHRPPVSMARTTSLHLLERRSSGYVRSLDLRASWSAAPAYWPARLRGWLEEVKRDTRVVSTASCAPPHNGSPLAISSILLSSCRLMWSRLRSLRRVLVVTLAPASRQTLAAALSPTLPLPNVALGYPTKFAPLPFVFAKIRMSSAKRKSSKRGIASPRSTPPCGFASLHSDIANSSALARKKYIVGES